MTAKETIEEKLKELAQVIAPDDRLVEQVMSRIDTTSTLPSSALTVREIWRKIMKNRTTRLAAAAVTVIAIVLSIIFLDRSVAPAYAVSDMPGLFEKAKVIHIQGWQYFPGHRMPDGDEIPPVEIDNWIDRESGRSRFTYTGLSDDRNGISRISSRLAGNKWTE